MGDNYVLYSVIVFVIIIVILLFIGIKTSETKVCPIGPPSGAASALDLLTDPTQIISPGSA